jgi:predicted GIY-YIG superfamily endonuclease
MNCCYLLYLPGTNRTYIGATKDPAHRLRQHNGELAGGAKATHGHKWTQAFYLSGFPDWRTTLQFEWAWKYHGRKRPGLKGKVAALTNLLSTPRATKNSVPFSLWNTQIQGHFTAFQGGLVNKIEGGLFLLANSHSLLPAFIPFQQITPPSKMSSKSSVPSAAAQATKLAELEAAVNLLTQQFADLSKRLSAIATAGAAPAAAGGKARRVKKEKDPNAPKKPLSSYMLFCNAKRAEVKAANPDLKMVELSKLLGTQWKALSKDQQEAYKSTA